MPKRREKPNHIDILLLTTMRSTKTSSACEMPDEAILYFSKDQTRNNNYFYNFVVLIHSNKAAQRCLLKT